MLFVELLRISIIVLGVLVFFDLWISLFVFPNKREKTDNLFRIYGADADFVEEDRRSGNKQPLPVLSDLLL